MPKIREVRNNGSVARFGKYLSIDFYSKLKKSFINYYEIPIFNVSNDFHPEKSNLGWSSNVCELYNPKQGFYTVCRDGNGSIIYANGKYGE